MFLIGALTLLRAALIFVAQMAGAIAAAGAVQGLFPGPLKVNTALADGTSSAQGVFIEMFLTTELVFVIFMLAGEKHKATFLAPIGIGLALFVSEMCGVFYTGGSLNPARSFGPAVVTGFQGSQWIYWVGPFLGTLLAFGFYRLMKYVDYETANPGQDFNEHEIRLFNPPAVPERAEDVERPIVAV
jgi:aquaporin rerated protein, other eukaryote